MKLVHISIKNFRGISELQWSTPGGVTCLVGRGDSGKTTILEAIELVTLGRSWFQFVDSDFFNLDTSVPIEIDATFVELPTLLLSEEKLGLDLRGWSKTGDLHDEPEEDDQSAVTIRLRVDDSLEPSWMVVSTLHPDGRYIGARDRGALGVLRIGEDAERHLSWGRASALTRVTHDPEAIDTALAKANKQAHQAVGKIDFQELGSAASAAGDWGERYGSSIVTPLSVGIDPRQLNVGTGALGLQQGSGVPARAIGLGSRRLLALAIQRQLGSQSLTLIDEIESGLEPHRLRHLLRQLKQSGSQVLATSHSETTLAELGSSNLVIVLRDGGGAKILSPDADLQNVIRSNPEAFLSRRVVACEGATEWGVSIALSASWDATAASPLAAVGTVFIAGDGSSAPGLAAEFARLGFASIYWGDSDVAIHPTVKELETAGVSTILWSDDLCIEQRVAADFPEGRVEELWNLASELNGADRVSNQFAAVLQHQGKPPIDWSGWLELYSIENLRTALGSAAKKSGWFKSNERGMRLGALILQSLDEILDSDLAVKLAELRALVYAD